MSEQSAGCVPCLLTNHYKLKRLRTSKECSVLFNCNYWFATKHRCGRNSRFFQNIGFQEVDLSTNKVMLTVSWVIRTLIHIDFPLTGTTISGDYDTNSFNWFHGDVRKKLPCLFKKKRPFHWDNAGVNKCVKAKKKFIK